MSHGLGTSGLFPMPYHDVRLRKGGESMTRALILLLALAGSVTSALPAPDPFVGRWEMNVRKSRYPAGGRPASMMIEMEAAGRGIHYRSATTLVDGRTVTSEYVADYDGRQVVVTGSRGLMLPVSLKRVDSSTVVADYMEGLQVVATSCRVVSRDGRTMTVTTTSKDRSGKTVTNVGVYQKKVWGGRN